MNRFRGFISSLSVLVMITGCSAKNNLTPSSMITEKEGTHVATNSPKGKGALVAYYPHSGSLLQGFTWFQPFIINGKDAGNIPPHKNITCYITPGTYIVSTTHGGFGLPNNFREQAKRAFTVVEGKTTYVQFNVSKGANSSRIQVVAGSKSNASTTEPATDKCKI